MSTIATLQYNPYSNREKKGYTLYTGYAPYVVGTFSGINFNPADGVNTELILNTVSDKADYLLVLEGANNTIASRWFILDADRTRGGQYHLTLYRDVVYDNLPEVMGATAFIEKGWINDVSNPLLFNEEALPTNQRKIDEYLLTDSTQTPWIVGYLPKNINIQDENPLHIDISTQPPSPIIIDTATWNKLNIEKIYNPEPFGLKWQIQGDRWQTGSYGVTHHYFKAFYDADGTLIRELATPTGNYNLKYNAVYKTNINAVIQSVLSSFKDDTVEYIANHMPNNGFTISEVLENYDGKYIQYNNATYKVKVDGYTYYPSGSSITTAGYNLYGFQTQMKAEIELINTGEYDGTPGFQFLYQLQQATIKLLPVPTVTQYNLDIPSDAIRINLDTEANYTMFCMPYYDIRFKKTDNTTVTLSGKISTLVAQGISQKYSGAGVLIDLQLLPYCPIQETLSHTTLLNPNPSMVMESKCILNQVTPIYKGAEQDEISSYLFWCCTPNLTITQRSFVDIGETISDYKINGQTLFCRLCAPDKSAIYEFSPNKIISPELVARKQIVYQISCTYKPYKPFIFVEPMSDTDSLYGSYYTDGRGLICAGDFSLPQTSDAWETYQIQNKNYSNIFNRQVQSIELQNKYAMASDITHAITGTISGAAGGATTGFAVGGPAGAIIGGAVSGLLSAGAGTADIMINDILRKDQLDLKKDLYQYNLQNIQALPNTLLNVGALTDVNKLYPYIEVYDCTDVEKQALYNKIKYNGMSIGVISEGLSNYLIDDASERSFIKGQIIKIDLHDDYHMLKQIRQEFETGFFINRGGN